MILDALIQLRRALARAAASSFTGELGARHASILRELRGAEGLSQAALAQATASDPSLVVRILDDLEGRGLVTRERSTVDRREKVVALTDKGREALKPLDARLDALSAAAAADLSADERQRFIDLATKVTQNLVAHADASSAKGGGS